MKTCNNTICPKIKECARHESNYDYETMPVTFHFNHHSGLFACEEFLYKTIENNLNNHNNDSKS